MTGQQCRNPKALGATVVRLIDDNLPDIHYIMANPEGSELFVLEPYE